MNLEEFLKQIQSGDIAVRCQTSEQRQELIHLLVSNGVCHGASGVSLKMLADVNECRDRWMVVYVSQTSGGIEFCSDRYGKILSCDELVDHLLCVAYPQVDDLL